MDEILSTTEAELAAVFELWHARSQADPDAFTPITAETSSAEYGAGAARNLVDFLFEVRSKAAHPTAAAG